ncbi:MULTISPECIES: C40 family peptidase [Streptomyces]|uniref:NlpC/P60 family protein n=1 Tax=Streptomyces achmelvichensis TaxID=3134111 RepID=A0ACC6PZW2_9ACTN|nr:NlpC/P60 family protein [Streptomyces sp. NBC_01167]
MSALASHRKTRSRTVKTSPAVGFTTAALASVTLLSTQSANAAPSDPKPSVEEVQKKVDDLYRQAGTETQKYNQAKEATEEKRQQVGKLLDENAQRTEKLNESRQVLGNYAAAQYRTGAVAPTAALLFADSPQQYFDQTQLMDRMTDRQRDVIADYETQRAAAAKQRAAATESLESLTRSQRALRTSKQDVQAKLAEARELLSRLTAEEKARLAAIERKKADEARRKAEQKAEQEAKAEAERQRREKEREQNQGGGTGTAPGTGTGSGSSDGTSTAKAAKVLDFARAQIGKPYVWGAAGPSSYDCSGLTQAAWKTAGVSLPRTTWDQVKTGKRVETKDLLPGDLVFFYDDISHVGIYIGDGKMIHAPKPGANVREESIFYMPIYGSVRPA